jgi:hypothetical protein
LKNLLIDTRGSYADNGDLDLDNQIVNAVWKVAVLKVVGFNSNLQTAFSV